MNLDERLPSREPKDRQEATATKRTPSNIADMRVLIVEDDSRSINLASSVLRELGISEVQVISNVALAMEHLRAVTEGRAKRPHLLILDLEFSLESGFEVLRYWKATPKLKDMKVVVWTIMGELEQKISRLFGVEKVVDKHLGAEELEKVLRSVLGAGKAS